MDQPIDTAAPATVPSAADGAPAVVPAGDTPSRAPTSAPARCRRCGGTLTRSHACLLDRPRPYRAGRVARPYTPALSASHTFRNLLRTTVAVLATVALAVALPLFLLLPFQLTDVDAKVDLLVTTIVISALVAAAALGILYLSARVFAGVVMTATAVTLVAVGPGLMIAGLVVRQMVAPQLDSHRGFVALVGFGAIATAAGTLLASFCLFWSMKRGPRRQLSHWARGLGAGYGVLLTLGGLSTTLTLLTLAGGGSSLNESGEPISVVEQSIGITAFAAWWLVPGVLLTYQCISAAMGEGSSAFRAPIMVAALAAWAAVLATGQFNMARESPLAAPMPLLHVLAASLPPIALVGLAARGSPLRGRQIAGLSWRQVTLAAAVSMGVATVIASVVESLGGAYGVMLILVHDGVFKIAETSSDVSDILGDAEYILSTRQQFVAGLIVGSLFAPVAEEIGKSLGVRFLMSPHSTRAQCFLLGAVAGAAFGFLEAMLYGYGAVAEQLDYWWWIMLLRAGSTSGHVVWSGIGGLAWWHWTVGRQHRTALLLFATAMLGHALWNATATAIDSRIFFFDDLGNRTLIVITMSIVVVVSAANLLAIPLVSRRVRAPVNQSNTAVLDGLQPWLAGA